MPKAVRSALRVLVTGMLAFIGCDVEDVKPIPPNPSTLAETGQKNRCDADADCWCRNFDGKYFLEGKRESHCCQNGITIPCLSLGHCVDCRYDSLVPSDKPRKVEQAPVPMWGTGAFKVLDGEDGYPLILYEYGHRIGPYSLVWVKCGDAYCHYGNTASGLGRMQGFDFALGAGGFPILVSAGHSGFRPSPLGGQDYAFRIQVAQCRDHACSGVLDTIRLDTAMEARSPRVMVGTGGLPTIGFINPLTGTLRLIACGTPDCSTGNTVTELASRVNPLGSFALLPGPDGNPLVAFADQESVRLIHCRDRTCSLPNPATEVVRGATIFAVALSPGGLPVFAYVDSNTLKVGFCGNSSCSDFRRSHSIDSGRQVYSPKLVVRKDTIPIVLYGKYGGSMEGTLMASCKDTACREASIAELVGDPLLHVGDLAVGRDGSLLYAWAYADIMFRRFMR